MKSRARQDELIRLLRRRGITPVSEIVNFLRVSRRTVLRDVKELREQGFVIHASSGPGGGLHLDPKSILTSPKLTGNETFALLISIAVLKQTQNFPFFDLADSGLRKIEQALPRDRVLEIRKILENVYIGESRSGIPLPIVQEIKSSVLMEFEICFLNSRKMKFQYTDRKGTKTTRVTDPHAILVLSPAWYIVGFDTKKLEFRHFRMDRIESAMALDEPFLRRELTVEQGECPFVTSFI